MSKKAPAKKGAAPPPEPVPVVEEPPKPSPEELAALAKVEEERRIREHNVARVTFPKLPIKRIVSHHSSTILAAEAPVVVALADVKENEVRIAFRHRAGERGYIVASEVAETVAPLLHFRVEELGDERFAVTLGDGHAIVDGVRVEGTCDWLPGMVQAEAANDAEMPVIAGVFLNRLRDDIPLGSDPTVAYGLGKDLPELDRSAGDFTRDTPYSTYTRKGLPAGPINNPGQAALLAVLNPERKLADGRDAVYFLHGLDGKIYVNHDYAAHLRDIARYR